ncbi:ubiquitin carboxyl-terminal hydrolase 47-like isoform X2 [Ischnura elegans]|uniref:ubiquitin carboxyl-terminal hydrolase 47-like isoform X2 n=1 Tax=Ischnura elegans TaxID=197161 RepID=UPI001ED8A1C7|nr:ubiquitin carboxyl-terminal hydrolase 47-like isoform X2 [Ischnura elegans]
MVCAAEEEDTGRAICVVRDMRMQTVEKMDGVVTLHPEPTTTIGEFIEETASQFHCAEDSFDLVLVKNVDGASVTLKSSRAETLKDVGVSFNRDARNNFVLSDPKGTASSFGRVRRHAIVEEAGDAKEEVGGSGEHARPSTIGNLPSSKCYVGLVNQAMTCYLNSLLQALYMTPEFRNALYEWCYDGTEEGTTNSIPFHLQKLFLNLQTSSRPAVETTELTKSFGWESSTAWQQHDVQELCRVMFDALEQKFKNTPHSDLIQRLYEGNMIDSVKCRECSTEKCRKDTFLDIPLAVRPFGLDVAYGSVEEALKAFVQPETLDGNNQYHCESCNKKCDAYKMLKFSKFPYILTLHLKRFDFDCNTLHRIKLNDKVVFPKILDLNSFVQDASPNKVEEQAEEGGQGSMETKGANDMRCDDGASSTTDSGSALDEDHNGFPLSNNISTSPGGERTQIPPQTLSLPQHQQPPPAPPPSSSSSSSCGTGDAAMESQEDDEGIDVSSMPSRKTKVHNHINHERQNCHNMEDEEEEDFDENTNLNDCFMKVRRNERNSMEQQSSPVSTSTGPFVYELFSIMIHSGSATGGHYYAYIKDFATGEWLCFNDQSVTRITEEDIKKTYGGGLPRGYYSGVYSSSTNAYMLMYRQIDKDRNCLAMNVDQFPPHIKELLAKMREKEEQERAARERDLDSIKMKVFLNHPVQQTIVDARLTLSKSTTLKEAVSVAHQLLDLEGVVDVNQCRLVIYEQVLGSIECSFEGREDDPVGDVLAPYAKYDLLLETKEPDAEFEVYHPGGVVSKVYFVDVDTEEVKSPVTLRKNMNMTLGEYKECLYKDLHLIDDPGEEQGEEINEEKSTKQKEKRPPLYLVMEKHNMDLRLLEDDTRTLKKEDFATYHRIFVSFKLDDELHKPFVTSKLYRIVKDFVHIITLKITLPDVDKDILERMSIPPLSAVQNQPKPAANNDEGGFEENLNYNMRFVFQRTVVKPSNVDEEEEDEGIWDGECLGATDNTAAAGELNTGIGNWTGRMCVPGENEVSGRNSDQSASEDSSLTDSERTLVGDHQEEALAQVSSSSNSPQGSDHEQGISSPEEGSGGLSLPSARVGGRDSSSKRVIRYKDLDGEDGCHAEENWDTDATTGPSSKVENSPISCKFYFKATHLPDNGSNRKMLQVQVDKRMLLNTLKLELEPYVGVPVDCFKLSRVMGHQDFECNRVGGLLNIFQDGDQILIKLGRVLRKGDLLGKVFMFKINENEHNKLLFEFVLSRGQTVLQAKREILAELKKKLSIEIPLNRCRLRKKSWKCPGKVYLDNQKFDDDLNFLQHWEMFVQELPPPPVQNDKPNGEGDSESSTAVKEEDIQYEPKTNPDQLCLFARRWHPETLELGNLQEVVINDATVQELKEKLSKMSGIPLERLEIAPADGMFPYITPILSIHSDMDWDNQKVTSLSDEPFSIYDDGSCIYYRDSADQLKKPSPEERPMLASRCSKGLGMLGSPSTTSYSPRKERALKIYLDTTPAPPVSASASTAQSQRKDESEVD